MMKTYVNKEGYEIHATEKSYRLFYEKMGFIEKKENQEENNKDITKMSVKQLKAYCDEKGITYEPDAKKNGRAKNCRNSFITDGQAKQVCVEAINAVIRNKGLLRVQRQEEKVSPQYRVLERNLQRMKEEQESTETDLMKLLYERAEERYRTLEVRDGEFRAEEIKNILAEKKKLETFDENLYRKIIARIWVHGGNMAEVELINGSRVTAGYKD